MLPSMEEVLGAFEFSPVTSLDKGKVWRWRQSRSQTLVEFLTPSFSEDEDLRELEEPEVRQEERQCERHPQDHRHPDPAAVHDGAVGHGEVGGAGHLTRQGRGELTVEAQPVAPDPLLFVGEPLGRHEDIIRE